MQKVPFLLVVGDKEAEAGKVNVRTRGKEKTEDMPAAEFVEKIRKVIAEKTSSLAETCSSSPCCGSLILLALSSRSHRFDDSIVL